MVIPLVIAELVAVTVLVPLLEKYTVKTQAPVVVEQVVSPNKELVGSVRLAVAVPVKGVVSSALRRAVMVMETLEEGDRLLELRVMENTAFVRERSALRQGLALLELAWMEKVPADRIRRPERVSRPFVVLPEASPAMDPLGVSDRVME